MEACVNLKKMICSVTLIISLKMYLQDTEFEFVCTMNTYLRTNVYMVHIQFFSRLLTKLTGLGRKRDSIN